MNTGSQSSNRGEFNQFDDALESMQHISSCLSMRFPKHTFTLSLFNWPALCECVCVCVSFICMQTSQRQRRRRPRNVECYLSWNAAGRWGSDNGATHTAPVHTHIQTDTKTYTHSEQYTFKSVLYYSCVSYNFQLVACVLLTHSVKLSLCICYAVARTAATSIGIAPHWH